MPLWPASLPQTPNWGWKTKRQTNVAAFSPDVGEPKLRRRSTAVGKLCTGVFTMTGDQRETLEEFFKDDLADGSLPFDWVDPITSRLERFCFQKGEPYEEVARDLETFDISVNLLRLP